MKKIIVLSFVSIVIAFFGISFANDTPIPIPISAEQAFDAVQTQTDPITGEKENIILIDVRSRAEYFWVGSACQVDEILTKKNQSIVPDLGKAILSRNGWFLLFKVNGHNKRLPIKKVSEIILSPIAINIPLHLWDEGEIKLSGNYEDFKTEVEYLADDGYTILILFCGNGTRSGLSVSRFDTGLFTAVYEIDQPDGENQMGGFAGNSYGNVYNGYNGFPKRLTNIQEYPSVSWKDAGLPIRTLKYP